MGRTNGQTRRRLYAPPIFFSGSIKTHKKHHKHLPEALRVHIWAEVGTGVSHEGLAHKRRRQVAGGGWGSHFQGLDWREGRGPSYCTRKLGEKLKNDQQDVHKTVSFNVKAHNMFELGSIKT